MTSNYKITLDFQKGGYQAVLEGFRSGDTARIINVSLVDGRVKKEFDNNPYILVKFLLPNDREVTTDEVSINGDVASFSVPNDVLSAEGEVAVELQIFENKGGRSLLTSAKFKIMVTDVLFGEGDEADPVVTKLANYVGRLEDLEDEMPGKASTEYVDQQDAATLARAKTYADEGFRAEAILREAGDNDTLASAKEYADQIVDAEINNRKAQDNTLLNMINKQKETLEKYTDDKVNDEKVQRENKISELRADVEEFSDDFNSALSAEATARDSAVNAERVARENAINNLDASQIRYKNETVESAIGYLASEQIKDERDIAKLKTGKQDKLTAGNNITIENNVISAAEGGGDGVPEIVISLEQKTSETSVYLNLEQSNILKNNSFVSVDATQLGMGKLGIRKQYDDGLDAEFVANVGFEFLARLGVIYDTNGAMVIFMTDRYQIDIADYEDYINGLIDDKLGVIENGRY